MFFEEEVGGQHAIEQWLQWFIWSLNSYLENTFKDIEKRTGTKKSQVRPIETRAIRKLRKEPKVAKALIG